MRANDNGAGVGEHSASCSKEIKFKCACDHHFSGSYSGVQSDLKVHLIDVCTAVLTANTRRLTRAVHKLEKLAVPPALLKFYKDQEPFYYLAPSDEFDEKLAPKNYVTNLGTSYAYPFLYEGEVDEFGDFSGGMGISMHENDDLFMVCEGLHTGINKMTGIGRVFFFMKRDSTCICLTGLFEDSCSANGIYSTVHGENKIVGDFKGGVLDGIAKF
jgi:hypothetical protein